MFHCRLSILRCVQTLSQQRIARGVRFPASHQFGDLVLLVCWSCEPISECREGQWRLWCNFAHTHPILCGESAACLPMILREINADHFALCIMFMIGCCTTLHESLILACHSLYGLLSLLEVVCPWATTKVLLLLWIDLRKRMSWLYGAAAAAIDECNLALIQCSHFITVAKGTISWIG